MAMVLLLIEGFVYEQGRLVLQEILTGVQTVGFGDHSRGIHDCRFSQALQFKLSTCMALCFSSVRICGGVVGNARTQASASPKVLRVLFILSPCERQPLSKLLGARVRQAITKSRTETAATPKGLLLDGGQVLNYVGWVCQRCCSLGCRVRKAGCVKATLERFPRKCTRGPRLQGTNI